MDSIVQRVQREIRTLSIEAVTMEEAISSKKQMLLPFGVGSRSVLKYPAPTTIVPRTSELKMKQGSFLCATSDVFHYYLLSFLCRIRSEVLWPYLCCLFLLTAALPTHLALLLPAPRNTSPNRVHHKTADIPFSAKVIASTRIITVQKTILCLVRYIHDKG